MTATESHSGKPQASGDENFREVFLNTNVKEERLLCTRISHIEREHRRRAAHTLQKQREFLLNRRSKPDPMIIVERPPTYRQIHTAYLMQNDMDEELHEQSSTPRYMRPLKSRLKHPSTLPTMDAFTVKASKKNNIWEPKVATNEGLAKFNCQVPPSGPLSSDELKELNKGWRFHRPQTPPPPKPIKISKSKRRARKTSVPATKTFVTELPVIASRKDNLNTDRTPYEQAIQGVGNANIPEKPKEKFLQMILDEQESESEHKSRSKGRRRPQSSSLLLTTSKSAKPEKPGTAIGSTRYLTPDERRDIEEWLQQTK